MAIFNIHKLCELFKRFQSYSRFSGIIEFVDGAAFWLRSDINNPSTQLKQRIDAHNKLKNIYREKCPPWDMSLDLSKNNIQKLGYGSDLISKYNETNSDLNNEFDRVFPQTEAMPGQL